MAGRKREIINASVYFFQRTVKSECSRFKSPSDAEPAKPRRHEPPNTPHVRAVETATKNSIAEHIESIPD